MESTNPRARIEEGWAPPPAVEAEPIQDPSDPSDAFSPDDAAAFDATLGSLVEQFASLPPASYGEPPTVIGAPDAPGRSGRWGVPLAALGSMVLGGAVTLAILIGPQQLWSRLTGARAETGTAPAALATRAAAPPVEVKWTTPAPRAEPLTPKKIATLPGQAVVVAVVAAPVKPQAPRSTPLARKPSKPKTYQARKVSRTGRRRSKREDRTAGTKSTTTSTKPTSGTKSPMAANAWKDPYE